MLPCLLCRIPAKPQPQSAGEEAPDSDPYAFASSCGPIVALPPAWASLPHLQNLSWEGSPNLCRTSLFGTLPEEWSSLSSLQHLDIVTGDISGTLPSRWSALSQLQHLDLRHHRLSGSLPSAWSAWGDRCEYLALSRNSLSGTLPVSWSSFSKLELLGLSSNNISGPLPVKWSAMKSLAKLDLSFNRLNGSLPSEWGGLTNMQNMGLARNELSNSLPVAWSALEDLSDLGLYGNMLTGPLPVQWSNLGSLVIVGLSENLLTGTLHAEWGSWKGLKAVNMLHNNLSGTLPPSWRGMEQLSILYLSGNSLSGPLPPSWKEMPSLQILNIRDQTGVGFSGGMPASWRRFCLQHSPRMAWCSFEQSLQDYCSVGSDDCGLPAALYGLQFPRRGVVPFIFADEVYLHDTKWKCNACIYPYSFTVAATLFLVLQPVLLLMVIAGMFKRLVIRSERKHLPHQQARGAVSASSSATASSTFSGSIFSWMKFSVVVGGAVVTDGLVLIDIWGSAAGYTLLATMLLPHAVCAVALGVCFSRAPRKYALAGAAGEVASNLHSSLQQGGASRAIGWVEQELEGALASLFTRDLNAWWHVICCALLLVLWPFMAVVLLPLGAWVKGSTSIWTDVIAIKSSSSSSSSSRNQVVLGQLHPQRLVVLYHWVAAVFEASTSLVLISILLVMGVQPRFGYVVESARLLYASLAFSILHLLMFTWDMIMCLALSQSKQQWVAALVWPFKVACGTHGFGGKGENPEAAPADSGACLELQPLII